MGAMQRNKGKAGEREAAKLLAGLLGVDIRRKVRQHEDDPDLDGLRGWSVEVKRAARPRLAEWWAQAVAQANGSRPVLLYRLDRQDWRVMLALADMVPALAGCERTLALTIDTSVDGFAAVVRETLHTGTGRVQGRVAC